ncbi:hypothetical protein NC651_026357 [Populus alba x Populus x berolinensis]|nr:hypothetical protein NC651_026357 [Populus alba x Populus x berolinensis]
MEAEKLFLLFSLLMLQFSSCTSLDSLKKNQTIKEGDLLISKGNNFALGFFSPGSSSNRYLGIWNKMWCGLQTGTIQSLVPLDFSL